VTAEIHGGEPLPDATRARLEALDDAADVQVFIAAACPHCPQAVRAAHRLALAGKQVRVTVIDAQRFPGLAEQLNVKSVPTTVLDGDMSFTGVVPAPELAGHILSRGTSEHAAARFALLIEAGNVNEGIERVLAGEAEHFLSSWKKSATSQRIVLMTIAEEVLEQAPEAFHAIVPELITILSVDDAPLRGDTADLLGQIGHPDGLEALMLLLNDPVPDVAEIAAEALGLDE
jgi:thioredoxin-like negative regulator of GroEL